MIHLPRIDPPNNMARIYRMDVEPDLIDDWRLITEWDRIGQAGAQRNAFFASLQQAGAALSRNTGAKVRRSYTSRGSDGA